MLSGLGRYLIALAVLPTLIGCRYERAFAPDPSDAPGMRFVDPNNAPFTMTAKNVIDEKTGETYESTELSFHMHVSTPRRFSMAYDRLRYRLTGSLTVPIGMPDGRTARAVLDTGCPYGVHVSPAVITHHKLAIFPLGHDTESGRHGGVCHIPVLQLGEATIRNPRCMYDQTQWQLEFLGVPLHKPRDILVGLEILRGFGFVAFDGPNGRVHFSAEPPVELNTPSRWSSYPLSIRTDAEGQEDLIVEILIAGEPMVLLFDTGAASTLVLEPDAYSRLEQALTVTRAANVGRAFFKRGRVPCRRLSVRTLPLGDQYLRNVKILVLKEPYNYPARDGTLGLSYFQKTVVILDFKTMSLHILR